jgi:hypothetical protein
MLGNILLHHGANPNVQNANGNTPLLVALCKDGTDALIKDMLLCGADASIKNHAGISAAQLLTHHHKLSPVRPFFFKKKKKNILETIWLVLTELR